MPQIQDNESLQRSAKACQSFAKSHTCHLCSLWQLCATYRRVQLKRSPVARYITLFHVRRFLQNCLHLEEFRPSIPVCQLSCTSEVRVLLLSGKPTLAYLLCHATALPTVWTRPSKQHGSKLLGIESPGESCHGGGGACSARGSAILCTTHETKFPVCSSTMRPSRFSSRVSTAILISSCETTSACGFSPWCTR